MSIIKAVYRQGRCYFFTVTRAQEGGYVATCEASRITIQGDTMDDLHDNIHEALQLHCGDTE